MYIYICVCDCGSKLWHPSELPKKLVFRDVHPEGKQMSLSIIYIYIYIYVCVYIIYLHICVHINICI